MDETVVEGLTEGIRVAVAVGRRAFGEVVEDAVEVWEDEVEDSGLLADVATEIADRAFAAHLAEQGAWPEVTDGDRLSMAMLDLALEGVVSREWYTCCGTCGNAEIAGELGPDSRGYVFYHQQDAEGAVEGGGLYLSYGTTGAGTAEAIAAEVVAALGRRGLEAVWDGDVARRVFVPMTWRRRRFGPLAAHPGTGRRDGGTAKGPGGKVGAVRIEQSGQPGTYRGGVGACRDALIRLVPEAGNFVVYEAASGEVLQFMWQGRLWGETPDAAARCSHGRYVTVDEALEAITTLTREGRVDLGEVETLPW